MKRMTVGGQGALLRKVSSIILFVTISFSIPIQWVRIQNKMLCYQLDCAVFWGTLLSQTLNSHSTSLHPGLGMATGAFNAGGCPAMD